MKCKMCSGHTESAAGAAAWLPRVPVRLPLHLLWCHPAQLHSDAQPDPERVPSQHAAPRPLHPQPEGGQSPWHCPGTTHPQQLHQHHPAGVFQEGNAAAVMGLCVSGFHFQARLGWVAEKLQHWLVGCVWVGWGWWWGGGGGEFVRPCVSSQISLFLLVQIVT